MPSADIADRFKGDTADHELKILRDDGLYRHLRFTAPGGSLYWFDLVTWPGYLAFTGDMDGCVFSRTKDMFGFFRGSSGWGINPSYWAEKVQTGRDSLRVYDEEVFRKVVVENFVDAVRNGDTPRGLGKAVREEILNGEIYSEDMARAALDSFEYRGFRFTDTWEQNFTEFNWSFLWCCHAIVWGIGQYDAAQPERERATAGTEPIHA